METMGLPELGLQERENYLHHVRRIQKEMSLRGIGSLLLFDSINIRYACGFSNEQIFQCHTPSTYLFLPVDGLGILHYRSDRQSLLALGTLGEVRDAIAFTCFAAGPRLEERASKWAKEVKDHMRRHSGADRRLAVDRIDPIGVQALKQQGVEVEHGQSIVEVARAVKTSLDLVQMEQALAVAEAGIAKMRGQLRPGITENELWSYLHQANIASGGEWIETRLLSSGERTNPWFQECSNRTVGSGELVAFDTDLIGPHGSCANISRTFLCQPGRPSGDQRRLYRAAYEQIQYNLALIRPGISFREFAERSWRIPDEFLANRYPMIVHGVGMGDEYPCIAHKMDWDAIGYDGMIEEAMTLCVESYIGREGGKEGVKLEEQVVVTASGCRVLSKSPFEDQLVY
jgi:Xaa-Pro aminopeptidase